MSVSWTDEQLKAMEPGDGSLLVSAAAGSGKTAVLIERVLRRITDEKDPRDLDEFLIVTYTNAAASEMRYKLAQAIEDRIRETGNDRRLIRQLRLLPGAQIMTVHSFCHYFLRENFQALGLSPDFKIADSSELALL
ncbi:MAG: UvrD-helicase domain-containing protein, partial [Bacillota bacterium]|nr:UvrD-helicase domain-containing protein [Bacillota bacterium]